MQTVIDPRDEGDIAQDYQARLNAAALANHRAMMSGQLTTEASEICMDCDDDIPAARRAAQPGCSRCADCQAVFERLGGGM